MHGPKPDEVEFSRDARGITEMAIYIAELVKRGIVYKVARGDESYYVSTTGGY
jgi:hypothetical protein